MRNADQRVCACGCGEAFRPVKAFQKFKNRQHLDRYHTEVTRRARSLAKEMLAREVRQAGA